VSFRGVQLPEIPPGHPVSVFHRFWSSVAKDDQVAPWSVFDAAAHAAVLPWILLLRREDAGEAQESWRYTVCGTGCTELFGFSYQGKIFGENLPPEAVAERLAEFQRAAGGAGPQFSHTRLPIPDRNCLPVFRGVFPFSAQSGVVDRILVVLAKDSQQVR
jgi:hypothetical protein